MDLNRVWWGLGGVLLLAAAIVCLLPMQKIPEPLELSDKASHLLGHGALAAYFSGLVSRRSWWKLIAALILFGIAIEFAQTFMNLGRNGDLRDVLANVAGTLAGLFVGWLGLARWPEFAGRVLGRGRAAP